MVWPFTSSTSTTNSSSPDPFSKLDPSLRQILDRDSLAQPDSPPLQSTSPPTTAETKPAATTTTPPANTEFSPPEPGPPTLFPDGRYAHLWKTYRSQAGIEAENKSDQERLSDVLTTWKDRNASVGKAALENCAAINMELDACWRHPSLGQRFTMCREQTRALDRCVSMNTRFLKTLGYLSSLERSAEQEEEIQMHADRLYTRMLEREKEREAARKEGSVVGREVEEKIVRPPELDRLTETGKKQLEERLKGLSGEDRIMEEQAFAAEMRAGLEAIELVEKYRSEARQARAERIDSGKALPSDKLQRLFGW